MPHFRFGKSDVDGGESVTLDDLAALDDGPRKRADTAYRLGLKLAAPERGAPDGAEREASGGGGDAARVRLIVESPPSKQP